MEKTRSKKKGNKSKIKTTCAAERLATQDKDNLDLLKDRGIVLYFPTGASNNNYK